MEDFEGLHGDEVGDCEAGNAEAASESDDEDVDTPAEEWSLAKTALLRPCPANIPVDLKRGDRIVVWFGAPFSAWYVGTSWSVSTAGASCLLWPSLRMARRISRSMRGCTV